MSNEVGVNPDLVKEAATALEQLRDALDTHVPVVVKTLHLYWQGGVGSPVDLSCLQAAQKRSADDAADMRARSNAAQQWLTQHIALDLLAGGGAVAQIPWSGKALDKADADYQAQALAAAQSEASTDPQAARQQIDAVEHDIQDHTDADDKQWLQDFYNQAAPSVVNLAQTLHDLEKGTPAQNEANKFEVLSKADQTVLKTFGTGLAAADKAGLSAGAITTYGNPSNAWSAAMLVKYGPDGSDWAIKEPKCTGNPHGGQSLLSMITNKVYEDETNGTLKMPVGFGGYGNYDSQDQGKLSDVLGDYDPLTAMMTADTQNKNASWQVMGGPHGRGLSQLLLGTVKGESVPGIEGRWVQDPENDRGQRGEYFTLTPPGKAVPEKYQSGMIVMATPDQKVVGSFLDSSTSAPRGHTPDAKDAAWAATNIIGNTPSSSEFQESPQVQTALLHTAQRYLLDLSESTTYDDKNTVLSFGNGTRSPYVLKIKGVQSGSGKSNANTPLSMFLNQILSNPKDSGTLKASVSTSLGRYYAIGQTSGFPQGGPSAPDDNMASLLGRINTESGNIHFNSGQQKDETAAETNSMISFASSAATWIPVVGGYISKAESLAGLFGVPTDLATDNAANAATANSYNFADSETNINVPMVQALINARAIPASELKDQPWLVNGKIMLSDKSGPDGEPSSAAAFSSWWDEHNNVHQLYAKEAQYQQDMQLQQSLDQEGH